MSQYQIFTTLHSPTKIRSCLWPSAHSELVNIIVNFEANFFNSSGGTPSESQTCVKCDRCFVFDFVLISASCSCNFQTVNVVLGLLAFKSGIDGHPESPQVSHSRSANTAQHLNSVYVVASSD